MAPSNERADLPRIVIDHHQIRATTVHLNSDQQHYLYRVLRQQSGDRLVILDGQGQVWLAHLNAHTAELIAPVSLKTELPVAIHLWVAPPKGNGIEDVIRQATEVGVTHIHPILSDRTLLQPSANKLERWQRVAQEAAEQSERQIVLQLSQPVRFQEAAFWAIDAPSRYLCVTRRETPHLLQCLKNHSEPQPELWIATGPEGGWSDAEVERAIAVGVQCVSLGARILRAVTAPIVAASLVAAWYEAEA